MRILILSLLVLPFFFIPEVSYAQLVPCNGPDCGTCELVQLGNNILRWLVSAMAVICAIIIVFAGFKMVTSAGNSGEITKAKEMIANTLIGFIVLLAAWLIVDTVMRMFVNQEVVGPWNQIQCVRATTPVGTPPGTGVIVAPVPGACTIPALTPAVEEQGVIWTGTDPRLQPCVTRFINTVGGSIQSAYRSPAYQTHLWEVHNRWCTLGLQSNSDSACSSLRSIVGSELSRHALSCSRPVGVTSNHSGGTAVDISSSANGTQAGINAANAACLTWYGTGDPVHYTLRGGCTCN